jgi:hypothetical protein
VSSVYHLWVDRLKQHDAEGRLDDTKRRSLVTRLAGSVQTEDERRYTPPALYAARDSGGNTEIGLKALLSEPADPQPGLTVLFGPGGIGKSFFLRHMSSQLGRHSCREPLSGIPVYAELPLLLHTDALETWLSSQGIRLPLDAIRVLVEDGVIVPVLDALDELVRGQAREGSRQFLRHLREITGPLTRGVLSSRDYYLNLDPLVPNELGDKATLLSIGFFDRPGRRRYVQVRTSLQYDHAARWISRLESQAAEALNGADDSEIEPLIGHPLFLDAFCQMIMDIPPERRASEVESFQLRSPDIFGEIVDRVLRREHDEKFLPAWHTQGNHQRMSGDWKDPFTPALQKQVFREIVLETARSGGTEALKRSHDDPRYKDIRHGAFRVRQRWRTRRRSHR